MNGDERCSIWHYLQVPSTKDLASDMVSGMVKCMVRGLT
jgi:hypothetical protein